MFQNSLMAFHIIQKESKKHHSSLQCIITRSIFSSNHITPLILCPIMISFIYSVQAHWTFALQTHWVIYTFGLFTFISVWFLFVCLESSFINDTCAHLKLCSPETSSARSFPMILFKIEFIVLFSTSPP